MSNQKILDYLEQNVEGVAELAYFMQYGEELTSGAIMVDIEVDHFSGYEYCLAIMLLAANDIVIDHTRKRLFLQWFRDELANTDEEQAINRIANILEEEHFRFEARQTRLEELGRQKGL